MKCELYHAHVHDLRGLVHKCSKCHRLQGLEGKKEFIMQTGNQHIKYFSTLSFKILF